MSAVMHYFVDALTGIGTGKAALGPPEFVASRTPAGMVAVPLETFDPLRQRVAWVTDDFGVQQAIVQPRTPARPDDDAYQTWAWDEDAADWLASPTLLARQAKARAARGRLLAASDWVAARAYETATPVPAPWGAYRAALRDVPEQPGFPDSITWPTPPTA